MKNLPIGIQTFSTLIEDNYLYIDKTKEILLLIKTGQAFFLSRPRRFGKSLLVSTLKEIFSGNRELFKGLFIYDKIDWQKYPVIHIDFSMITYDTPANFTESLGEFLRSRAGEDNIHLTSRLITDRFAELLKKLSQRGKVVVLIDEYDKPIIDLLSDLDKAGKNREMLRNLFTALKGADQYLRFVFLTGVSKFSKVSLFSGLNNLLDITLDERFATIAGITEKELEENCADYIETLARKESVSPEKIKDDIKEWYNGYSWDGVNKVYNPTSLFTLFIRSHFSNYWFATGTPTFLIELIKQNNYNIPDIEEILVGEQVLDSYDLHHLDINSLLFQTGYVTIKTKRKKKNKTIYTFTYPNYEVKESLLNYILADYIQKPVSTMEPLHIKMIEALEEKDINTFTTIIQSIFAGISSHLHIKHEYYYHSLCYMILTLMGARVDLEVLSDKGRVDAVLHLDEYIYVIEFKMGTAAKAMEQIKKRRYYEVFQKTGKPVYLLGVGGFTEKKVECLLEPVPD